METPEADAVEQHQQTVPEGAGDPEEPSASTPAPGSAPLEVDEGDLAESTLEVPLDEDDWR
jgi:hypothetical protein